MTKILIFDYWPKLWFLSTFSIIEQNFNFCPHFRLLTNILIFSKFSIFDQNFDFCQHFRFWPKNVLDFYDKTFVPKIIIVFGPIRNLYFIRVLHSIALESNRRGGKGRNETKLSKPKYSKPKKLSGYTNLETTLCIQRYTFKFFLC